MLSQMLRSLIVDVGWLARQALNSDGAIEQIDTLVNGETDYAALITDEDLAASPEYASTGLTKQQIMDTIYCVKTARAAIRSNLSSVTVLASLPSSFSPRMRQ